MSVGELLRMLQMVPAPHDIFPCFDTPYSKYSDTNHVASGWEFPAIRGIISEQKAQLGDIDTIIGRMETTLNQFREKREQIASSIKMHQGFVSGIRHLPSEILQEVFVQCLPQTIPFDPDVKVAPLLLTRICRGWREVALNSPRLWSSMVVKGPVQRLFHRHDWLKKAKGYPLSLKVNMRVSLDLPIESWRKVALDFLQLYTSQLVNFTICFDEGETLEVLFRNMPKLERLCLRGDMTKAISIAQPQPRLRTLTIHSPILDTGHLSAFNPWWRNLTHLAVVLSEGDFDDPVFLPLLQMCPNLEHLVFSPLNVPRDRHSIPASFTHQKLRVLDIGNIYWNSVDPFTLILPNLHSIYIRADDEHEYRSVCVEDIFTLEHPLHAEHRVLDLKVSLFMDDDQDHLFSVLNPGWTIVTQITMEFTGLLDFAFSALKKCPNLEDLVISLTDVDSKDDLDTPVSHTVLRSLSLDTHADILGMLLDKFTFPGLRHLDLSLRLSTSWAHAEFKNFLSRSGCPLETLKIKGANISIEEQEELVSLVSTLKYDDTDMVVDSEDCPTDLPVDSEVQ